PFLVYTKAIDFVMIFDGRSTMPTKERYDQPHASIIELCNEAPKYLDQICEAVKARAAADRAAGADMDNQAVERAVQDLVQKRILYEENGRYLTLALPANQTY